MASYTSNAGGAWPSAGFPRIKPLSTHGFRRIMHRTARFLLIVVSFLSLTLLHGCSGGGSGPDDSDDSGGEAEPSSWNMSTCRYDGNAASTGPGELAVSSMRLAEDSDVTDDIDDGTTVYYPDILETSSCTFKVIGWGNGTTGSGGAYYPGYFNHLASHGFVVAVSHTNFAAAADQPVLTSVNLVMAENDNASSIFHRKLDAAFGLMGKSQGAIAVARELSDPEAVAGVLVAAGSGEENALSKPGLFLTGDADFAQLSVASAYDLATGEAIFAQVVQAPNPDDDVAAGHMDLDDRTGVIELSTSFMRCQLRDDPDTCDFVYCESCQVEPWSIFKTKTGDDDGNDDGESGSDFPIQTTYAATGAYTAISDTSDPDYHVFYPDDTTGTHPVITWGNAAGGRVGMYSGLLSHLASWGFVVVASTSSQCRSGMLVDAVDFLSGLNADPTSPLYGQLDLEIVGASGHSLGGGCAIGAGNDDPRIRVIGVGNSAPQDSTMTDGAMFIMGAADDVIANPAVLGGVYDRSEIATVWGTLAGGNHFTYMGNGTASRGYATAWFMAELQGDSYARAAFYDACEICSNPDWAVLRKNVGID
jgi:hypothetical protein